MARIKCQSCGSESNQDGDQFCGDCGTKLVPPPAVMSPVSSAEALPAVIAPVLPPVGAPSVAQPAGPKPLIAAKARLVVKRSGRAGQEFPIDQDEMNIGRWDADSGIFPEIDLSQDDQANVISRKHAKISVKGNEYYLEDTGSLNGTYVNRGPRLSPGSPQKLGNGDEVVIGRTFFTFVIDQP